MKFIYKYLAIVFFAISMFNLSVFADEPLAHEQTAVDSKARIAMLKAEIISLTEKMVTLKEGMASDLVSSDSKERVSKLNEEIEALEALEKKELANKNFVSRMWFYSRNPKLGISAFKNYWKVNKKNKAVVLGTIGFGCSVVAALIFRKHSKSSVSSSPVALPPKRVSSKHGGVNPVTVPAPSSSSQSSSDQLSRSPVRVATRPSVSRRQQSVSQNETPFDIHMERAIQESLKPKTDLTEAQFEINLQRAIQESLEQSLETESVDAPEHEECPVCMEAFDEKSVVREQIGKKCRHVFCQGCISKMRDMLGVRVVARDAHDPADFTMQGKLLCPLCRVPAN